MTTSLEMGNGLTLIQQLDKALAQGETVCLGDDGHSVRSMGVLLSVWHWKDREFHEKRLDALAGAVAKVLAAQERMALGVVHHDRAIQVGSALKKQMKEYKFMELGGAKSLTKEIAAIRLGICSRTLDANPGFQAFAEKYYLSQYLIHYDAHVKVAPETLEVSLKKDHEFTPWSQLKREIDAWPVRTTQPQQPWGYGEGGVQDKDMYGWRKLTHYKKEDPKKWNHQYVYQRCVCRNPGSKWFGIHAWVRLYTPEGYIYSVGLYANAKQRWEALSIQRLARLLSTQPAHLMSPDVSEAWPIEIRRISRVINKDDFDKIVAQIEQDKDDDLNPEKGLIFQQFNNSCTLWCKKLEALAGIVIDSGEPAPRALIPTHIYNRIEAVYNRLPTFLQRICTRISILFWNTLQWLFGANIHHPNLTEHQRSSARRPFQSFSDFMSEENYILNNPGSYFEQLPA